MSEDAAPEAFLKAYRNLAGFRGEAKRVVDDGMGDALRHNQRQGHQGRAKFVAFCGVSQQRVAHSE